VHVVEALCQGFDGVLAVVCSEKDCKLEKGRETVERNAEVLRKMLQRLKLADRFELFESSPRNVDAFNMKIKEFVKKTSCKTEAKPVHA